MSARPSPTFYGCAGEVAPATASDSVREGALLLHRGGGGGRRPRIDAVAVGVQDVGDEATARTGSVTGSLPLSLMSIRRGVSALLLACGGPCCGGETAALTPQLAQSPPAPSSTVQTRKSLLPTNHTCIVLPPQNSPAPTHHHSCRPKLPSGVGASKRAGRHGGTCHRRKHRAWACHAYLLLYLSY